jgi:hypothetical protein
MQKMWACIPGLPARGQPEANIETCEWYGGDNVPAGIELWGCRDCIEQPWEGDWKNECLSGSSSSYPASTWTAWNARPNGWPMIAP